MKISNNYFRVAAFVWTGCLVLFLLVHLVVLGPQKKLRQQVDKQLTHMRQTYGSVLSITQEKNRIRLNEQIRELENRLKDFVIDTEDSADLTLDISEIARAKNVDSPSITSDNYLVGSKLSGCEHIYENHINISFNGDFGQFVNFVNALERHRPVVFVESFTIARSNQENLGHRVTMKLAVYVRRQQAG